MKHLRSILALVVLSLLNVVVIFGVEPEAGKKVKELRVLSIGNSFTASLDPYLVEVSRSVPGCSIHWERIIIGGSSLKQHWTNIQHEKSDPQYRYFPGFTYQEKLRSQRWDIVSIQQASHFSWKPDTYFPYAEYIRDFVRENAPQAELVLQQTWSYRPDEPRLTQWGITQQEMYDSLDKAYQEAARKLGVRVIPVGKAIQLARETEPGGYKPFSRADYVWPELPEMKGFLVGTVTWSKDHKKLEGDAYHLNPRGRYLQACVWFAFLFNQDPTEITFIPKEVGQQDAIFLRNVAKQVVFGK